MGALGRDWRARMAARFGGRLYDATFTRKTVTGVDPADPAGPPLSTSATYTCEGIAFAYDVRYLDGEHIKRGDYRVLILRGTVQLSGADSDVVPEAGDTISIPPPGGSVAEAGRVVRLEGLTEAGATVQVRGEGP